MAPSADRLKQANANRAYPNESHFLNIWMQRVQNRVPTSVPKISPDSYWSLLRKNVLALTMWVCIPYPHAKLAKKPYKSCQNYNLLSLFTDLPLLGVQFTTGSDSAYSQLQTQYKLLSRKSKLTLHHNTRPHFIPVHFQMIPTGCLLYKSKSLLPSCGVTTKVIVVILRKQ